MYTPNILNMSGVKRNCCLRIIIKLNQNIIVFSRYKRKGSSALGLHPQKEGISWEESSSNKKQRGGDKKKATDRYYSAASRQLLRSGAALPLIPKPPDCGDDVGDTSFLPLGDTEGENLGGHAGKNYDLRLE